MVLTLAVAAGCSRPQPPLAPTKPTEVVVDRPVVKELTEYEDFTGRTEAVRTVDLRARVTGYLKEIKFKDGASVAPGDELFVIDPDPYHAELEKADASLKLAEAHLERSDKDLKRYQSPTGRAGVSQSEIDRAVGDRAEAEASVGVARATRRLAQQNLDYCTIRAPFAGRMSRRNIDPGNLVKQDDTLLSTLVALDPIYAYFDIDERTLLNIRRQVQSGRVAANRDGETVVRVGLADEEGFSFSGVVNFVDNRVDPGTGTLRLRAEVSNPKLAADSPRHLLSPGLFVRYRLPIGAVRPMTLVPEEAVGTDQGQKYVYVVNAKDEVEYRQVRLGQQYDQLRAVDAGVNPTDRVVVSGLQRVRQGVKVTAKAAKPAGGEPDSPGKVAVAGK